MSLWKLPQMLWGRIHRSFFVLVTFYSPSWQRTSINAVLFVYRATSHSRLWVPRGTRHSEQSTVQKCFEHKRMNISSVCTPQSNPIYTAFQRAKMNHSMRTIPWSKLWVMLPQGTGNLAPVSLFHLFLPLNVFILLIKYFTKKENWIFVRHELPFASDILRELFTFYWKRKMDF